MKSEKSRIFRSYNKTRWDKDRESKKVMLDWLVPKIARLLYELTRKEQK